MFTVCLFLIKILLLSLCIFCYFNFPGEEFSHVTSCIDQLLSLTLPSIGLTIWSFSGRKVLKTVEPSDRSDRLEKEESVLPIGELQPLPPPPPPPASALSRACSFFSRSARKNWRSDRTFWRRSDRRWSALMRSLPPGDPGWPIRVSSLWEQTFVNNIFARYTGGQKANGP